MLDVIYYLSGRRGSNPRHSAWKADALPTELLPHFFIVGNFTFAKVKIIFISCKYFLYFFKKSGESRIRTYEAEATELQSVPFSHSGISPNFFKRASRGIRTHDPEITNHVLWPTELWRQFKILKELLSYLRLLISSFAVANIG